MIRRLNEMNGRERRDRRGEEMKNVGKNSKPDNLRFSRRKDTTAILME
jgi:hypothetical protein